MKGRAALFRKAAIDGFDCLKMFKVIILSLLLLAACGKQEPPPAPYVATVNGQKIFLAEFEEKLKSYMDLLKTLAPVGEGEFKRIREAALDSLIVEKLILQRAQEVMVTVREEDLDRSLEEMKEGRSGEEVEKNLPELKDPRWRESQRKRLIIEALLDREVSAKVSVTNREAQEYYNKNRSAYVKTRSVRAVQIVLRDREKAGKARKRLVAGEDFGQVARELSIGPEASRGGDLGFLPEGIMPESFDKMAFSLPPGRISPVFKTLYGYHIIKVLARDEGGEVSFPQVKNRVIADLKRERHESLHRAWIEGLKAKAVVVINKNFH